MKVHKYVCFVLWGLWGIGLSFAGVSLFCFQHNNDWLFWKIMMPYNLFIQMVSLIPVEPFFCTLAICDSKKNGQPYFSTIILFCITFLLWLAYITLYVWWTGGI
ncbi:MAG: hypothetical protein IJ274_12720 [Lachnospiraceae bacterium]|nr:hypothetical protein [Lachnospiraceae bacterium]